MPFQRSFLFTMQVRVPYKKLIKEYAEKLLPDPIQCEMGESIEALEGRVANEVRKPTR